MLPITAVRVAVVTIRCDSTEAERGATVTETCRFLIFISRKLYEEFHIIFFMLNLTYHDCACMCVGC